MDNSKEFISLINSNDDLLENVEYQENEIQQEDVNVTPTSSIITIANHPVAISELEIGHIVAVANDDPNDYWIGEIMDLLHPNLNNNDIIIKLFYYQKNDKDVWYKMKSKSKGSTGTCKLESILVKNITFKSNYKLYSKDEKTIQKKLLEFHNNVSSNKKRKK